MLQWQFQQQQLDEDDDGPCLNFLSFCFPKWGMGNGSWVMAVSNA